MTVQEFYQAVQGSYQDACSRLMNDRMITRFLGKFPGCLQAVEFDDLTGVYTRQAFCHHMQRRLAQQPDTRFDLAVFDIKDFKRLNEFRGEAACTELLKELADFLRRQQENSITGRYGTDQFVMLLPDADSASTDALMAAMHEGTGKLSLNPDVRIGLYEDLPHDVAPTVLCDRALSALSAGKEQYGVYLCRYDEAFRKRLERIQIIEDHMREALEQEQYLVYYQPKHDSLTGKLVGAEALVRWIHPTFGFMSPSDFIPLFERNGFISEVDRYIWQRTCQNLRDWQAEGLRIVPISVNGSKRDFEREDCVSFCLGALQDAGVDPEYMHLEITETLIASDIKNLSSTLQQFRDAGVHIELDDFGTGYSSLNMLGELPLDIVKLDMSFVRQIEDPKRARIFSACVNLTKSLDLKTVSEGVETPEQYQIVRLLGVDSVQGYYFSKPLPEAEFKAYLRKFTPSEA